MACGYGFDGKKPVACSDRAERLARVIIELIRADENLNRAIDNIPDYTGQWERCNYYANEQEDWYRAAEKLEGIL